MPDQYQYPSLRIHCIHSHFPLNTSFDLFRFPAIICNGDRLIIEYQFPDWLPRLFIFGVRLRETVGMESQEDKYTIGQLIKDLSSYETLVERSDEYRRRQAGQQAIKGSRAAHYAIQANITRSDASKVWDRIPSDAFDLIRPLCESRGDEFEVKTLKLLRANLCIRLGEKEPEINAMSLSDFAEVSADLIKKGLESAEKFADKLRGAQAGLQAAMESLSAHPSLMLPDHLMPRDDSENTKANHKQKTNKDDPRNGMTAEQIMGILLDKEREGYNPEVREWSARKWAVEINKCKSTVTKTAAWKQLQYEKSENKEGIKHFLNRGRN